MAHTKQMGALQIYGYHLPDCPCYIPEGKWSDNPHHTKTADELVEVECDGGYSVTVKCTCGFEKVIDLDAKTQIITVSTLSKCPFHWKDAEGYVPSECMISDVDDCIGDWVTEGVIPDDCPLRSQGILVELSQ